jgi:hypothetical protein
MQNIYILCNKILVGVIICFYNLQYFIIRIDIVHKYLL